MNLRRTLLMAGALWAAVLTSCTTISRGEPIPATTVETTSSEAVPPSTSADQELPYAGAPKVDDPLDTQRFQEDPCQALTAAQAEELTFPPSGAPREMPLGNACEWTNPGNTGRVTVHFLDGNPNGLSAEYQANKDGKTAFFEELTPIGGYPAVATDIVDDRGSGRCTVVVGVSDKLTFEVPISLSLENIGKKDPCQIAVMVAGMALETMKNG